jgi:hypothetical protein
MASSASLSVLLRAADAGIAGKWDFVLDTEGGERKAPAEFTLDGDNVTGKWGGADVKGTFTDGKLDLSFPFTSDEAGPGTLGIKGKLDGEALVGDWSFQTYSGTFKATRPAA